MCCDTLCNYKFNEVLDKLREIKSIVEAKEDTDQILDVLDKASKMINDMCDDATYCDYADSPDICHGIHDCNNRDDRDDEWTEKFGKAMYHINRLYERSMGYTFNTPESEDVAALADMYQELLNVYE